MSGWKRGWLVGDVELRIGMGREIPSTSAILGDRRLIHSQHKKIITIKQHIHLVTVWLLVCLQLQSRKVLSILFRKYPIPSQFLQYVVLASESRSPS